VDRACADAGVVRIVAIGIVVAAVLGVGGSGPAEARSAAVTLSLSAVVNPVPSGQCTAPYYTCQTYLNPTWSFTSDDLRFSTNGSYTSGAPCFALHTDLGTFGAISIASGGDSTYPPAGAPVTSGAWRVWCYGFLPKVVNGGDQGINLTLQSTTGALGTATVDAWLLRGLQLPDFAAATMAHTTIKVQFGGGAAPSPAKLTLGYEMPTRFGPKNQQGLVRYPTGKSEVNPARWPVLIKPSACPAGDRFLFSVDGKFEKPTALGGCQRLHSGLVCGPGIDTRHRLDPPRSSAATSARPEGSWLRRERPCATARAQRSGRTPR
jgi:hypothetical protein